MSCIIFRASAIVWLFFCAYYALAIEAGPGADETSPPKREQILLALDEADKIARTLSHRSAKTMLLALIGRMSANIGDSQGALKLFDEVDDALSDAKVELTYSPRLMIEGYAKLNRNETALHIMEKYDAQFELHSQFAQYLIFEDQLSEASKICLKIENVNIYRPLGMLAYAYYKKGNQKEMEKLIKNVSTREEAGCIFYRDLFAAQARWQQVSGNKAQVKSLLQIAEYWQTGWEKLQENDFHKESERIRWAKQQARAGDVNGAVATLAMLPTPKQVTPMLGDIDSTWDDYSQNARWLLGMVEPQRIVDYLNSPYGKVSLPEHAKVIGLAHTAFIAEALKRPADSKYLWNAALQTIKHEQDHAPVTLGLVYSRIGQLEKSSEYLAKSKKCFATARQQLSDRWDKTKSLGMDASPGTLIDHLIKAHAVEEAFSFLEEILPFVCSKEEFNQREESNKLRIYLPGFELMHLINDLIEIEPNTTLIRRLWKLGESIDDPYLKVQLYLGIASGQTPPPPLFQGAYSDSFDATR